jgi:tetratricopeptide (TPR) repeat protein
MLYASLVAADPGDRAAARRAIEQAILAGDMSLALRLARLQPRPELSVEAQLLLVADALRKRDHGKDLASDLPQQLAFMAPFVRASLAGERGDWREALKLLDGVAADAPLIELVHEHKALILLAAGRAAEARPVDPGRPVRGEGPGQPAADRLCLGLVAGGEPEAGLALLAGRDVTLRRAAASLASERRPRLPIAAASERFSELVTALAVTLDQDDGRALPLALAQIARHSDPRSEQALLLTGLLLDRNGRADDAIALLRAIPDSSPFQSEARDAEVRTLLAANRKEEALARARAFAAPDSETAEDWIRLGDVFDAMNRHREAAVAYGNAATAVQRAGAGPELWSIHLLRGAALEQADMWPQAESALELAHKLAPDNASVLNYLGYARLERGEQLDEAEALIAEASRRAPDDASITDSLGWAQYKRGKVDEAVATLQRAAAADPGQAEIHEHLGDALYSAGRKYEARFAWNAALVTAEDEVRKRVEQKIAGGLSPATAAP